MTLAASIPRMRTVFHIDLSDAPSEHDYRLNAHGDRLALKAHTPESLATLHAKSGRLKGVAQEKLTHYTEEVEMPSDQVVRVHIERTILDEDGNEAQTIGHVVMHVPPTQEMLQANGGVHDLHVDWDSTARTLISHHPDLMVKDPVVARIIEKHLDNPTIASMIKALGLKMRRKGEPGIDTGWARLIAYKPDAGKTKYADYDGTKTYYYTQPIDEIIEAAGDVMTKLMLATKNDLELAGKKWRQDDGVSVEMHDGAKLLTLAAELDLSAERFTAKIANDKAINGFSAFVSQPTAGSRSMVLKLENSYIRYLGAYIRFFDAQGNTIKNWNDHDNTVAKITREVANIDYDDLRFIGHIGPITTIMSIPIFSEPGELKLTIQFPENAVRAQIFGSGLGTGNNEWPKTPIIGGVLTGLVNLAIPAFMMGFGVAQQSSKGLYDAVKSVTSNKVVIGLLVGAAAAYFGSQFAMTGIAEHKFDWKAAISLSSLLFNKAFLEVLLYVELQTATAAANAIPFAGWIMAAINISLTLAQMAQTIVEVATSTWNIEHKLAATMTTNVTISPDPRSGVFPASRPNVESTCVVKMIYKDEKRPTVSQSQKIPQGSLETKLTAKFPDNTLGGQVKFEADYFIGTWLAAKATTGWRNNDAVSAADIAMVLVQFPVPLDEKSVYLHNKLLAFKDGRYGWIPTTKAPTATLNSRSTASEGNAISEWSGISLSQRLGLLGFAWKAAGTQLKSCASGQGGQLHVMQTMSIPGKPTESRFPDCGFDGPTQLIFDPFPPKFQMKDGQWVLGEDGRPLADPSDQVLGNYYVDPRKANVKAEDGGGFHLRQIPIDGSGTFDTKGNLSWARFPLFPNSFALHPSRSVIAVNTEHSRLMVTGLMPQGTADIMVPLARTHSGQSYQRERRGLLFNPISVACAYDGTILVLEDSKSESGGQRIVSRIQAFDLFGNPVRRFFDAAGNRTPFLQLSEGAGFTYLDMAVAGSEKMTYIFVLYYTGDGLQVSNYHMAVFQYGTEKPAKNPLVTTDGMSAARLTADMWNSVYTLNWASVTGPEGQAVQRTVPSLSQWVPPVPA
jgi:hypothetical protein